MRILLPALRLSTIILFGFLLSCESKTSSKFTTKDVFRYNESSDIKTLDPAFAKNQAHIWVCNQLYNSLVQLNQKLEVVPSIAESWSINENATIYRFYLRKDIKFYNGKNQKSTELTAYDVEFSLNRLRSKELAAPGAWILDNVAKEGIKAIDKYTIEVELETANPAFLSLMSMQYASILSKSDFEKFGKDYFKYPIGTGPYYYKFWEDKVKLVLRKNPVYFEKDENGIQLPHLEAVSIRFLPDKHAAFLEFVKGNLDFVSGIDASYKDEVLSKTGQLKSKYQGKINLLKQDYLNTEYLAFLVDSTSFYPYTDVNFRKAVNFGFDRQLMMKHIRNGIGTPAENGFIPKGLMAFEKDKKYHFFSPDSVEYYLKKAKYIENGYPEIVLHTNNSYLDLCEYIQNSLNGFGIKTKVTVHPSSTLRQLISKQKVQFFRASWIADYPDSENYLSLFYGPNKAPNGPNYSHFDHIDFDENYVITRSIGEHSKRIINYKELQKLVMNQSPVVPLYYDEVYAFIQKDITGFKPNALNLLNVKNFMKN